MKEVSTVGVDIAKKVFQVHAVDRAGAVSVRCALRRGRVLAWFGKLSPCLVGMEACATAHYWARELKKLGHEVRLIPPAYAKAYVRRNKNDPADRARINPVRQEFFGAARPASTLIGVAALALPGMKIEVEAVAGLKPRA